MLVSVSIAERARREAEAARGIFFWRGGGVGLGGGCFFECGVRLKIFFLSPPVCMCMGSSLVKCITPLTLRSHAARYVLCRRFGDSPGTGRLNAAIYLDLSSETRVRPSASS